LEFFALSQYQRLLWGVLAILVVYAVVVFLLPRRNSVDWNERRLRRAAIGMFGLLAAIAAIRPVEFLAGFAINPLVATAVFIREPLAEATQVVRGAYDSKVPYRASRVAGAAVHILIIGESSRRDSWSLYGYGRTTTPYLQSISRELVFFRNAVSDGNTTVCAVPILLTGTAPDDFDGRHFHGNLVDLAKEAGYHTSWLVNNDASISYMVGMAADTAVYPHSAEVTILRTSPPDGVLWGAFTRQLTHTGVPQFIGMHTFGSHTGYSYRYPPSFAKFGRPGHPAFIGASDQELLDTYDNSLLYMDWFLQQIIEAVRPLSVPVTVTYVADHGEELPSLDGESGHGFPAYSKGSFEIPAFVWMNDAFKKQNSVKVTALAMNHDKLIRTHDFFYALADVMGIRWPGYAAQRSFWSASFVPDRQDGFFTAGRLTHTEP
jgi:glucan phosphoethanolaminetransferase (alkaline phosphatase superfamily)